MLCVLLSVKPSICLATRNILPTGWSGHFSLQVVLDIARRSTYAAAGINTVAVGMPHCYWGLLSCETQPSSDTQGCLTAHCGLLSAVSKGNMATNLLLWYSSLGALMSSLGTWIVYLTGVLYLRLKTVTPEVLSSTAAAGL